jgi:hypothetical protein
MTPQEVELKFLQRRITELIGENTYIREEEHKLLSKMVQLGSENARLREALEWQLKVAEAWTKQAFGAPGHDIAFLEMRDAARAALEGK